MPRLKKRPDEVADSELIACIAGWMWLNHYSVKEAATLFEMSESTLRRRMKDPGSMTLGELRRIVRQTHMADLTAVKVVRI